MRRSSLIALFLTVALHAVALGALSLWSVESVEVERDLDTVPAGANAAPTPASPAPQDTVSIPVSLPEPESASVDTGEAAQPDDVPAVTAQSAAKTTVTPVMMFSWQKGGNRRKTYGLLPTLEGPLAEDIRASFKVTVAPDGAVRSVRVLKSKDPAFGRAAVARIKTWKFEPLRSGARRADQLCTVTMKAKAR